MSSQLTPTPIQKTVPVRPASASQFWNEIGDLMKNIEKRAYELFEWRGRQLGHDLEDWFKAERELFKRLPIDIKEKDNSVFIRAEVPGFKAEELEILLEPRQLMIKGSQKEEKEKKEEKSYYSEMRARDICRKITLPVGVEPDKAEATLSNGVLEIKAPKAMEAKKITVTAA